VSRLIAALLAGSIFGAGLALSGMADPQRVRAFLDVFGHWDPTLAFVMAGALVPMALAWAVQRRSPRPAFADSFNLPSTRGIDAPLVVGAMLFGVGWGLSGLCPGPAIAGLAIAPAQAGIAVTAMIAGMVLHRLTRR